MRGRSSQPSIFPCLKHQNGPERGLPIPGAVEMLAPPAADRRRLEYSLSRQAPLIEEEFCPIAQLVPEPGLDRHGETHLRPIDQFARHVAVEHTPQEALAHAVSGLHRRVQRPTEGNKSMIEQRYARFE